MENKEILKHLRTHRDITAFAKYIGISPQGLYKLLKRESVKDNQQHNLKEFVFSRYTSK